MKKKYRLGWEKLTDNKQNRTKLKMFGMFGNDDDEDFTPSPSSKLSSLFNSSAASDELNSSSLMYRAPRQPKPKNDPDQVDSPRDGKLQSSVVLAKVITLWTMNDNKQKHLGKHIIAVIGCVNQNLFEAIIYKEKNHILLRRTLNESCTWHRYANNFVSFYDSNNQFWTLSFENANDKEAFLNEILKHKCPVVDRNTLEESKPHLEENNGNSDSDLSRTKADILSRITKMGQQILPQKSVSTVFSDSESDDMKVKKPVTTPRKSKKALQHQEKLEVSPIVQGNSLVPNNQIIYPQPYPDFGYIGYLATQNAELKTNLAEINHKLNRVLNDGSFSNDGEQKLKSEIKILRLKIENINSELEKSQKRCDSLREEYKLKCKEVNELSQQFKQSVDLEKLERDLEMTKMEIENQHEIIESQTQKLKELELVREEHQKCQTLKEEIDTLKVQIAQLTEQKRDDKEVENLVRKNMNDAFKDIMEKFDENTQYSLKQIQQVVLKQLKKTTYDIIEELK